MKQFLLIFTLLGFSISFAQKIELSLIIAALVKLKLIQQSHISRIYFAYKGNQSRLLFTVSLPGG